jgi:hypothetical protein
MSCSGKKVASQKVVQRLSTSLETVTHPESDTLFHSLIFLATKSWPLARCVQALQVQCTNVSAVEGSPSQKCGTESDVSNTTSSESQWGHRNSN